MIQILASSHSAILGADPKQLGTFIASWIGRACVHSVPHFLALVRHKSPRPPTLHHAHYSPREVRGLSRELECDHGV
jgi:hypothetical protein